MVMEAVMVLLGEKTDWASARQVLSDAGGFLNRLLKYEVIKCEEKLLTKLRKNWLSLKEFDPEDVGKKSMAAKSLCVWCIASSKFQKVWKDVEPKRQKAGEMKQVADQAIAELNEKMAQLKEVKDKVAKLEADCQQMQDDKQRLEEEMDRSQKRMARAE